MYNYDNINQIIAENITFLRNTNKMTQRGLAEKLNYSDKAVSKWERGDSIPDIKVLLKIAEIFQVDINYLIENHGLEELPLIEDKKARVNLKAIINVSLITLWALALLAFLIIWMRVDKMIWHIFIFTVPVSFVLLLVFTSVWGRKRRSVYNFWIISGLCWDLIITAIFVLKAFISTEKLMPLLLLGFFVQLIVCFSFRIYKRKK